METNNKTYFPRVAKALAFSTAVYTTYTQASQVYAKTKEWYLARQLENSFTVTLDREDSLFKYLSIWLFENCKEAEDHIFAELEWIGGEEKWEINYLVNIESVDAFTLPDGTFVRIGSKDSKTKKNDEDSGEGLVSMLAGGIQDHFTILEVSDKTSLEALKKFLASLRDRYATSEKVQWLYLADKERFRITRSLLKRSLDTIFFNEGVLEEILSDIKSFREHKEQYINFGIPYHRGYLLHGPPGTGKTSIVRALSTEYNMNVYSLSLNDIKSDREILQLFSTIDNGSILLIEDIDGFGVADARTEKSSDSKGVSISGLLNALDGVQTLHDCIIIMTSNHPEHLDPALMRPGRIDRQFYIGHLDTYALTNMIKLFTGEDHVIEVNREVVPVEVIEIFKRNMMTPDLAINEVKELVS